MNTITRTLVLSSIALGALSMAAPKKAGPVKYTFDPAHSELGFKVTHLVVSTVKGTFDKFDGTFDFDAAKNVIKNLKVSVDTSSVNTREVDRDKDLRSDNFFATEKFPKAIFTAKEVKLENGKGVAKGELQLRDKKLPQELNITYKGAVKDAYGNDKTVFEASGVVERQAYGVSWNKVLDNGGLTVGNEVTLEISAEAVPDVKKVEKKK